jgi:hypothetical protein
MHVVWLLVYLMADYIGRLNKTLGMQGGERENIWRVGVKRQRGRESEIGERRSGAERYLWRKGESGNDCIARRVVCMWLTLV